MSDIRWGRNLGDSGMLGSDPERLCQYYFELAAVGASGDQLLALRVTGPNPPLLCWRLCQDVSAFAEEAADIIYRHGLEAAVAGNRFPQPPDL